MDSLQSIITHEDLNENAKTGMFIDQQLACDSLCWTLYAQPLSEVSNSSNLSTDCVKGSNYDVILLRGLITNDEGMNFSINHNYGHLGSTPIFGGINTMLESGFKEAKSAMVGVNDVLSGVKGVIPDDFKVNFLGKEYSGKDLKDKAVDLESKGRTKINELTNGLYDKAVDMARGSLMSGLGKAKYYEDSDISIKTPQINFRYYHGTYRKANGKEISVRELVNYLNNRFIGRYYGTGANGDTLGIMGAPNGFLSTGIDLINRSENNPITGTFCLEYAGRRIPNLLVSSYDVNLSNSKVMDYRGNLAGGDIIDYGDKNDHYEPLYADISISLTPVTIYTRENINQIMSI